jgi:Zn finger protein HypA/HybF involved in hydrogenase expression
MGRLSLTTEIFIQRAIEKHGDVYKYDKSVFVSYGTNIEIWCRKCSKFFTQLPGNHLKGCGCPGCAFDACYERKRQKAWRGFLQQAEKSFGNKFSYHLAQYIDSRAKIDIVCNACSSIFQKPIHGHLNSGKCPTCDGTCNTGWQKKTTQDFIQQAKEIHGDKYGYDLVIYTTGDQKVLIKCNTCAHIWPQKADNHLQGCGCPKCAEFERRLSKEEFIKRSKEKHGELFDYSYGEYLSTDKKFKLYCNKGQHFTFQTPHSHLQGHKCLECENASRCKSFDQFTIDACKIHDDQYEYFGDKYFNTSTKIDIKCKACSLIFPSTPRNHLAGRGCPNCGAMIFVSKAEKAWLNSLNIPSKCRQHLIIINGERFLTDAYDPQTNTIYEFHGDYWHGNPQKFPPDEINKRNGKTFGQLYQRTLSRENLLKQAGYNLITMWESEWKILQKTNKKKKRRKIK